MPKLPMAVPTTHHMPRPPRHTAIPLQTSGQEHLISRPPKRTGDSIVPNFNKLPPLKRHCPLAPLARKGKETRRARRAVVPDFEEASEYEKAESNWPGQKKDPDTLQESQSTGSASNGTSIAQFSSVVPLESRSREFSTVLAFPKSAPLLRLGTAPSMQPRPAFLPPGTEVPGSSEERIERRFVLEETIRANNFLHSVIKLKTRACLFCALVHNASDYDHRFADCPLKQVDNQQAFRECEETWNDRHPNIAPLLSRDHACFTCLLPWDPKIHPPHQDCSAESSKTSGVMIPVIALAWCHFRQDVEHLARRTWEDEEDFRKWCSQPADSPAQWSNLHLVYEHICMRSPAYDE